MRTEQNAFTSIARRARCAQKLTLAAFAAAVAVLPYAASAQGSGAVGTIYTTTNSTSGNAVIRIKRLGNGALTAPQAFYTGGQGTGASLGSQGAIIVGPTSQYLYAVDAGSNDVAVFRIGSETLTRVGTFASGGTQPVSITAYGSLLYVLNAGSDNIAGFRILDDGSLRAIPGSNQNLSNGVGGTVQINTAISTGAAEIAFTPDGQQLAVTEKNTNKIDVFQVGINGAAGPAVITASHGVTPYGFAFDWAGHAIVSEAAGAQAGAASVSSYFISDFGTLPITGSYPDGQTAACWLMTYGQIAWTTNAASSTISVYNISANGRLTLATLPGGGSSVGVPGEGAHPSDMATDSNHRFLYVLLPGTQSVAGYKIGDNGSLTLTTVLGGLGSGLVGIAGL